jgi:hypothetical protein
VISYTKALEAIKALRKDQVVEMKLDRQRLDHLAMDREKAQKVSEKDRVRMINDTWIGLDQDGIGTYKRSSKRI